MTEDMVKKFEKAGFNRWTKGGHDRLYIDATKLGLSVSYYKTGNISGADIDGEPISHARAGRILATKIWVDVASGEIYAKGADRSMLDAAKELRDELLADPA